MGALILPSRFIRQPQVAAPIDRSNPFSAGAQAIVSAGFDVNSASGVALRRAGTGGIKSVTAQGRAHQFRKNFYVATEVLPAIGTQTFVEFWYGIPSSDKFSAGNSNDPGFLTGSSSATTGIVGSIGLSRLAANPNYWGAVYSWGTLNSAGEELTPGVLTLLVVVRRQTGMEFWRNGVLVSSIAQPPISYASSTFVLGAFIENTSYWSSSSDTVFAGRIVADWPASQVRSFSQNPWQLFKAPARRLWVTAGAPSDITGTLAVSEGADSGAASGTVTFPAIAGTLASSEAADTLAAAGTGAFAAVTGAVSATETPDTQVAAGSVNYPALAGALATTEGADTLAAAGTIGNAVTGTLAATETADTAASVGGVTWPAVTGSAALTETADTLAASGAVAYPAITGALARTEQGDTLVAAGAVIFQAITGALGATEARDTLAAVGGDAAREVLIENVAANRIVAFAGGRRVVTFPGNKRVTAFPGNNRIVRF